MWTAGLKDAALRDQLSDEVELPRPESACPLETDERREQRGYGVSASQIPQRKGGSRVVEDKGCYAAQGCGLLGRPGCSHGGLLTVLAQPQSGLRGWHPK